MKKSKSYKLDYITWMLTSLNPSAPAEAAPAMLTGLGLLERLWLPGLKCGCAGEDTCEAEMVEMVHMVEQESSDLIHFPHIMYRAPWWPIPRLG